jgi:hypothetical protein
MGTPSACAFVAPQQNLYLFLRSGKLFPRAFEFPDEVIALGDQGRRCDDVAGAAAANQRAGFGF